MDEEGERGNKLFIIPTKGKSLFTFVISIELIRGWLARRRDESKFGVSTISRRREAGDLRLDGKGGRGGEALFTRVCVWPTKFTRTWNTACLAEAGCFRSFSPSLPSVQSGRRRLFIDEAPTRGEKERERESQAFISQVTRARDWRSIKGRFTRPDSDANRRKINTAYYSVRINRSTWAMSTNAISFCSKRVDIRGMRWPRSRRPGTDRPRSESLIEPRRRRRRRPLSFVLSNARDAKNVDRALDYIAVYRAQIGEERSASLRTIFAITSTHLEIIGNSLFGKVLCTLVSKKC